MSGCVTGYLIRRGSRGSTVNGRSVGDVYVTGPHFNADVWSSTYDPEQARVFDTEAEAEAAIRGKHWDRPRVVRLDEAPMLGPPE